MAHNVVLTWNVDLDATSGYDIYRGTAAGKEGATPINSTPVQGTTYTDTNVVAGQTYFYTVTAVAVGVQSVPSAEVSATVPLALVTGVTATAS